MHEMTNGILLLLLQMMISMQVHATFFVAFCKSDGFAQQESRKLSPTGE